MHAFVIYDLIRPNHLTGLLLCKPLEACGKKALRSYMEIISFAFRSGLQLQHNASSDSANRRPDAGYRDKLVPYPNPRIGSNLAALQYIQNTMQIMSHQAPFSQNRAHERQHAQNPKADDGAQGIDF